ncbi:MAG TPA: hypothetical protein VFT65_10530 [Candidatus Angelobacter sp.]|nr:hypothetical protein [Candidatus Angelobacter sp.]
MLGGRIAAGIVLFSQFWLVPQSVSRVFIPTSEALQVAQRVARDQGYSISNRKVYYFELMLTPDGKPTYPGYVTFGFYGNSNPLNTIAISETTGQVIDPMICVVFEYPDLKPFQEGIQRASQTRRLPLKELMENIGCDTYTVQDRPAKKAPKTK